MAPSKVLQPQGTPERLGPQFRSRWRGIGVLLVERCGVRGGHRQAHVRRMGIIG